jgi:hypothetical protein
MADENEFDPERVNDDTPAAPHPASNLPLIMILAALTIYFGFGTLQGLTEKANLSAAKSNQSAAIQEAQKVQARFKVLVSKTSELADQGHAGAKLVMEELLQRGVGASPDAKAPTRTETEPTK